ncbi:hypothetical protein FNV43_RR02383 [Rhamnella rubrinervis]|uniref:Uncharacterized protein n=1 Tax=Rhamnella rubrinervis TaxID=2594499 RepID=A0A8K0HTH5_9ROSA|nr:hypothetical protein FNV43_RR02383 [Rhamnella rubrinervis]
MRCLSRDENVRARIGRLRKDVGEIRLKATRRIARHASTLFSLEILFVLRLDNRAFNVFGGNLPLLGAFGVRSFSAASLSPPFEGLKNFAQNRCPLSFSASRCFRVERLEVLSLTVFQVGSTESPILGNIHPEMGEYSTWGKVLDLESTHPKGMNLNSGSTQPKEEGVLDLRRKVLDLGKARPGRKILNLERAQPREERSSTGRLRPGEEDPRPRESSIWGDKFSNQGAFKLRRKILTQGILNLMWEILTEGVLNLRRLVLDPSRVSTLRGRFSTKGELDLGRRKVLSPERARLGRKILDQGDFDLRRNVIDSGRLRPGKEGRVRRGEGVLDPRRESSTWGRRYSTKGKLDLGRKVLDPGKPRPGEVEPLPRESSTWGGRSSTQGDFDLGRKVLDPRIPRSGEVNTRPRESALPREERARPGEADIQLKESSTWGERSSTQGYFDLGRKILDPRRALDLGRYVLDSGSTQPERLSISFFNSKHSSEVAGNSHDYFLGGRQLEAPPHYAVFLAHRLSLRFSSSSRGHNARLRISKGNCLKVFALLENEPSKYHARLSRYENVKVRAGRLEVVLFCYGEEFRRKMDLSRRIVGHASTLLTANTLCSQAKGNVCFLRRLLA